MTTLPPEGTENTSPQNDPESAAPAEPTPPPAAPPAPPAQPAPGHEAPQAPGYAAPPAPGYGAPGDQQQGYPQGYQAPPQGYQGQPQGGVAADPASNLQMNYWLSVFFIWLPALIFYIIEKDKSSAQVRALHAANLNFALLRTALFVVGWFLAFIPVLGPLLLAVAHLALFILHIIAATKVLETYRSGGSDPFMFNIPMIK